MKAKGIVDFRLDQIQELEEVIGFVISGLHCSGWPHLLLLSFGFSQTVTAMVLEVLGSKPYDSQSKRNGECLSSRINI